MRLTIFSTMSGEPWGGSEELWYRVAEEAIKKNIALQVCIKSWNIENKKIDALEEKGASIIRRKELQGYIRNRFFSKANENGYLKKIKAFNPSAILISQGGTFDFFFHKSLLTLIEELQIPFFIISQFNTESGNILNEKLRNTISELNEKWACFYFVSKRNLLVAERQSAVEFKRTKIVHNPVNIRNINKAEWCANNVLMLCCIARYDCNYKGQDILIEALSSPSLIGYNYRFDFYGSGKDKAYLQSLVKFYKLEEKVFVNDHIADIDAVWEQHHALVLSSLAEGTPLVLQECMIKGRPALVTDVGGCAELIEDEVTGFVCKSASVQSLVTKLEKLFTSAFPSLKIMGDNAHAKAMRVIDFDAPQIILADILNHKN